MDNWIEELSKTGRYSFDLNSDIHYNTSTPEEVSLEGRFTIQQLQALIEHMKKHEKTTM